MAKNVYWRREILTFYIRISFDMDKVLSFYKAIASEKRRRRKRNKNNTMFGVGGGFVEKCWWYGDGFEGTIKSLNLFVLHSTTAERTHSEL